MVNDRFWKSWPWMAWVLPAAFVLIRAFSGGGWESILLVMYSPIIVGVVGFLGWLPRFILKKRGHRSSATVFVALMTAHWTSLALFLFSVGTVGDSRTDASFVRTILPFMSPTLEVRFQQFSLLTTALTCLVTLILAIILEPPTRTGVTQGARGSTGWWQLGAIVATPLLILGLAAVVDHVSPAL